MQLATINKGTSIPTFNSLLRPEIFKFGTEVTEKLKAVFGDLMDPAEDPLTQARIMNQQMNTPDQQYYPEGVVEMGYDDGYVAEEMSNVETPELAAS